MAFIGMMVARKLGSMLSGSHDEESHRQHLQDPYNPNHYHQNNVQYGPQPYYGQPPMHGAHCHHNAPQMARYPAVGRRAERHYRRAERTMIRAEHRAEKECRRAERDSRRAGLRGEIARDWSAAYRPTFGPAYPAGTPGYEMRDMGYGQQQQQPLQPQPQLQQQQRYYDDYQDVQTSGLESRSISHVGPFTHQSDDVPPPAYEEAEKKQ